MKSILRLFVVSGIIQTNHTFIHYFSIMPTLQLTNNEHQMLLDLFSTIADLDLNETVEDSDSQTFDSLWDKIIHLE